MEEISDCKFCKTWEEEMYWKHFNSMHFCQTLPPDFHDHLVLPEKFTAHMKSHLPDKMSLKGPSGALWDIELLKTDDLLFVGDGWKDFVKVNELKENYILVFKFKRNLGFEVLILDKVSSCEKESSYFVKKCRHIKSDHEGEKKRTAREVSSTEIIEDGGNEDSAFVVSKKSKGDEVVCSGGKLNIEAPRKRVLHSAAKGRGRSRRAPPRRSPVKPKFQSRKRSIRNETTKELSQSSQEDVIATENGENCPEKDHSDKLESQSKKSLNENDAAKELSQTLRELMTSENDKILLAADHSHMLKDQSEKQPIKNHSASEPRQISEMDFNTTKDVEPQATDHSPKLKPQSEKTPNCNDTSKEVSQILGNELVTPENGEKFLVSYKNQAEKKPSGRSRIAKELTQISGREVIRPDYRESSPEVDHSCKSRGKRGRPKKQVLSESSKKLVFKSESDVRKFSKEYMSNRRPVTEMEKEDALQRANQKQTENSFIAVMRRTSVYQRFFLSIPAKWMHKHLRCRNQEVVLRVGEKTWLTTLFTYGNRGAGISTGWKKFALDNFLEEFDVLVFNLVSQKDDAAAVMDVDIFRVVEEIVPPLPLIS